jgi:hypothetical protein
METLASKPLFIPLRREYYNAFLSGNKSVEYRRYGPGWNERTCWVGRPVMLSLGYGKNSRCMGVIKTFSLINSQLVPESRAVYGLENITLAAIEIELLLDKIPS